ncbi:unnamed protein product [Plutella xylostella]|uniref:(diamondback moth) hypothetical protein n=1 Tax=Plutella xylostella TaxID=51655 RepID=A0A8S4EHD3_PLUXY|nr:unnamed protein product [Plutella xylostella]
MSDVTLPLHLEPMPSQEAPQKRLWIGNLDTRVNDGPNIGQSRGFAFVTYKMQQDAIEAMKSLNGQILGSKKICVKFAKHTDDHDRPKPELGIAALAGTNAMPETKISRKTAIQSIEAKLKMMENMKAGDDFVLNKLAADEAPVIAQYQYKSNLPQHKSSTSFRRRHPYHRKK